MPSLLPMPPARKGEREGGGGIIPIIKIIQITVQTTSHQSKNQTLSSENQSSDNAHGRGEGIIEIIEIIRITVQTRNHQSQNQSSDNAHGGRGGIIEIIEIIHITVQTTSQQSQKSNPIKRKSKLRQRAQGGGRASFQSLKSFPSQFRQPTLDNQLHTF